MADNVIIKHEGYGNTVNSIVGVDGTHTLQLDIPDHLMDKLLGRMMTHTSKVITPCKWCGSHNAFSNPTCVKCGAPLG